MSRPSLPVYGSRSSVKSAADQAGKWAIAPIPRLNIKGGTNYSNLGGSSWYVISTSDNTEQAIDFLNSTYGKDSEFYQQILTERGAVGSYLPARTGTAYQQPDAFFGGQGNLQRFCKLAGQKIPKVNYGYYTYEADAAIASQLPAYYQGVCHWNRFWNRSTVNCQLKFNSKTLRVGKCDAPALPLRFIYMSHSGLMPMTQARSRNFHRFYDINGWCFVLASLTLVLLFMIYPILNSLWLSLHSGKGSSFNLLVSEILPSDE